MQLITLLDKITKEFPDWKKSSVKNVLLLALSVLHKETTCLYKLKNVVGHFLEKKSTQPNSHYKRLTRTITDYAFSKL